MSSVRGARWRDSETWLRQRLCQWIVAVGWRAICGYLFFFASFPVRSKSSAAELMEYRSPVGCGPSSNT